MNIMSCPCHSGSFFVSCCAPFLDGQQHAPTPEKLMRSRYSAYSQENFAYILHTQTGPAAQQFSTQNAAHWAKGTAWLGLTVHRSWFSASNPDIGYVEFTANYRAAGQLHTMREISEFHHIGQRWLYYAGEQPKNSNKIGRNDPCPCGSDKKYKKCCGK